jgi:predicted DNA-binding transcriptional regulator AlpA
MSDEHSSDREARSRQRLIDLNTDQVFSGPEAAAILDLSYSTLKRRVADGIGPIRTQLSDRRFGFRGRHLRDWLDQCAIPRVPQ